MNAKLLLYHATVVLRDQLRDAELEDVDGMSHDYQLGRSAGLLQAVFRIDALLAAHVPEDDA